ncbi:insulinase family protein [Candidatus Neptunochlamydia vexilliferae]|nr:insulinase family protein [Candidatus Neptunochlamydia vexilliferae]
MTPKHKIGDTHRDFTFTKVTPIEELQMVLYELEHGPSGARVVHLEADDPENLFCLSLQTLPSDSTGVAHILEHIVLCGSKKFPVKDPFFAMTRRSLNTFMNAMTGADFTCYPAASQVEKDFYNLLEVYLDAVFAPELKEMSFLQEGHRFEFDPDLIFKGVVYNEMKGSLSNPETRLWQEITKYLTPDLTYAFNSGGDPKDIPSLTYEGLKEFHATHYHPSRSIFFFYGNLPLKKHLDFIQKHALKGVEKLPPLEGVPKQQRFAAPIQKVGTYPAETGQDFVSFSWLTTELENQEEALALAVLDSILMETDASPLKDSLIKSGLCTQADGYLDTDMREIPYIIICRGCESGSTEKLQEVLLKTLEEIAEKGIKEELVDAAIHQLEFSRLEITGDYGPFGLTLFMRSILPMQHGCFPEDALTIHSHFKKLLIQVKDPDYLPGLIRKYLLKNPHFLTFTFSPDSGLEKREQDEEKKRLNKIEEALTEKEKETIVKQTAELEKFQAKSESQSLECLPKITLVDVPKEIPHFPLHREQIDQLTVFHHECFTNHIAYGHLAFDLPQIAKEDLPYLQLFLSILPELGAGERNYRKNLDYINAYLGDFGTFLNLYPQVTDSHTLAPVFGFKGKTLSRNLDKLFDLFKTVCRAPDLTDKGRIKDLILQIHTSLENRLNRSAMSYAIQRAVSPFSQASYVGEHLHGITYFQWIRNLAQKIDKKLPALIEKLKEIKSLLFHLTAPQLILSCDHDQYHTLSKEGFYGLSDFPTNKPYRPWEGLTLPLSAPSEAYPISSPVAFSAMGIASATLTSPHASGLSISTELMQNTFLHTKVREQGGAYGAGASYNPITGNYYMSAYRDPHIGLTFEAFEEGIARMAAGKFTDRELFEAKLGIIQDYDTPISPGSRAISSYAHFREGYTKEMRQEMRDHLLITSKDEVKKAVSEHLDPSSAVKVTFAGAPLIENEGTGLTKPQF